MYIRVLTSYVYVCLGLCVLESVMALAQEIHKLAQVLVCSVRECEECVGSCLGEVSDCVRVCVFVRARVWGVRIGVGDAACTEAVRKTAKGLSVCICIGVL